MSKTSSTLSGGAKGAAAGAGITMATGGADMGLATAGGALIGGSLGYMAGANEDAELAATQAALEDLLSIPDPILRDLKLKDYTIAGILTPEMEQAIIQSDSELKKINVDPKLKQAQYEALEQMRELGQTGLRAEDKLALEQIQMKSIRDAEAQRQRIMQDRQMRGLAGSGDELAAQLQSGQAQANVGRLASMQQAAQAQQAALQAMAQYGRMGGEMRSQEFGEQEAINRAQDEINRFNVTNRQGVSARNVDRSNRAQEYNLTNAQDVSNRNTELRNEETRYNVVEKPQQQWENEMRSAEAVANARIGAGKTQSARDQSRAQGVQDVITGAGQVGTAYASMPSKKQKTALDKDEEDQG